MLRHLGTASPHTSERKPWVLKTPFHTAMLDDLVAEYPKARVVMTHRRPVRALTSLSSFQLRLRSVGTDKVDPHAIAKEVFSLWDAFAGRAVQTRQKWAWADSAHDSSARDAVGRTAGPGGGLVDVALSELHTDPMAAVRRIYDAFELTLTPAAEAKMTGFLAGNGRDKHGANSYKAEWFGLFVAPLACVSGSGVAKPTLFIKQTRSPCQN